MYNAFIKMKSQLYKSFMRKFYSLWRIELHMKNAILKCDLIHDVTWFMGISLNCIYAYEWFSKMLRCSNELYDYDWFRNTFVVYNFIPKSIPMKYLAYFTLYMYEDIKLVYQSNRLI